MELQDKYDELENIESTLDVLITEITDKYYIDILNDIKYQAQKEKEEVEEKLQEEREQEERERTCEFERSRV